MYRDPIQRRNWFWISWILLSVAHFLASGAIIFCQQWNILNSLLPVESFLPVAQAMGSAFCYMNLATLIAIEYGVVPLGLMGNVQLLAMSIPNSALYGLAVASALYLAGGDSDANSRSQQLGFSSRVLGRGLLFAMGYAAISWMLGIMMFAGSYDLWPSELARQDTISALLRVMHPLAFLLGLDFHVQGFARVQGDDDLQYAVVMMLDSALIGLAVAWGFHWLRVILRPKRISIPT